MDNRSHGPTDRQRLNRICSILSIGVKRLIEAKKMAKALENSTAVETPANDEVE